MDILASVYCLLMRYSSIQPICGTIAMPGTSRDPAVWARPDALAMTGSCRKID